MTAPVKELDHVVVRFAGDSGDGMQLTGDRFTNATAVLGNDLSTFPDFPAEIRAPAGTLHGVSAFQIHFSDHDILEPGDAPNVLVAMNPAALKANMRDVTQGGILVLNSDSFTQDNLAKAGYEGNPITDGSLSGFIVYDMPMTTLTVEALKNLEVSKKDAERSKNMFALGLMAWMFHRPEDPIVQFIKNKFSDKPAIAEANIAAYKAGFNFGETAEIFQSTYIVKPASLKPGVYRNITGNHALAIGLVAAAKKAGLTLYYGSYPITPASDVLHQLARYKNFGVKTFQAEDEIAAVGSSLGAAFGGALGVTCTAGPGMDLKSETVTLAMALELPLIVIDVQRAGPSTGMPTKTEQADLLMAMYGRHGEAPVPIVASYTPSHCFHAAIEAARIALKYRTPVILLSDGFLANSSEPWLIPTVDEVPEIAVPFAIEPNDGENFLPYLRDPKTLARPWAVPGTPGLEHRIGGLEKQDVTGNISYDSANHEKMTMLRAQKVAGIADDIPELKVDDPDGADLLVVGWGSTWGAIGAGVRRVRARGEKVAVTHLVHLNPFPKNFEEVLRSYKKVLVPELNTGQLQKMIRYEFLVDAKGYHKVQGIPFKAAEIEQSIIESLGGSGGVAAPPDPDSSSQEAAIPPRSTE